MFFIPELMLTYDALKFIKQRDEEDIQQRKVHPRFEKENDVSVALGQLC